jgi:hypothetical protein
MSCVPILLVTIDVIVVDLVIVFGRVPLSTFYIQWDKGYKESSRVGYNYSYSKILSLIFSNYKI